MFTFILAIVNISTFVEVGESQLIIIYNLV